MSEKAPRLVSEVTDWNDPRQALSPFLYEFPGFGKMQPMPVPSALVPFQSELLHRMGLRFHPELAELVKVLDPKDGSPKWVTPTEAEELSAAEAGTPDELNEQAALDLLRKLNPDRASEIEAMGQEERSAALAGVGESDLASALNELARLRAALEVANDASGA